MTDTMGATDIALAMANSQQREVAAMLDQIHKARDTLPADIVDDGNMWMLKELDCGHIAAIPLGRNTANHHLVGDDDGKPLHPCCIEALRLKETT